MSSALIKLVRTKDIRRKLLYTLGVLFLTRIGSQIPAPGINTEYVQGMLQEMFGSTLGIIDLFTGGSFLQMSLFALGITPYITASIIIQLLVIVFPALEEMQKDGITGRKKMSQIMRCTAAVISLVEAVAMGIGFGRQGMLNAYSITNIATFTVALMGGSLLLMWMGERITEKGIGNGISLILLINILSRVPGDFRQLYDMFISGEKIAPALLAAIIILAIILATILLALMLQGGEQKMWVQYTQSVRGRKTAGKQEKFIPLKVNVAGVVPIIFASSMMQLPLMFATILGKGDGNGIGSRILQALNSNNWFSLQKPWATLGLLIYIVLTVFFAYFYASITFSPEEVAEGIRKNGGVLPGIRTGKSTVMYIEEKLKYMIFLGSCGLILIQLIPFVFNGVFGINVSFGGTSLIIITGVIVETIRQLEAQILERKYRRRSGIFKTF